MPRKKMDLEDQLVGVSDASHILGTSAETVRTYAKQGLLTPLPVGNGTRNVYRRSDVERLAAERAAAKRKGPKAAKPAGSP